MASVYRLNSTRLKNNSQDKLDDDTACTMTFEFSAMKRLEMLKVNIY